MQTAAVPEPPLPDGIAAADLDAEIRRDLRGLQKDTAETVARHLVAAGTLVDDDPELALQHARFARQRASRIAAVREAAGIAAYRAGEWSEALGELRAARRMGGGPGHLSMMADIERALGRPERALELARGPEANELGRAETIELTIVVAGARRDLGELDAAVLALQIPELDAIRREPWSPRLFYAYADNLLAAGRESDALQWFVHALDADVDGDTDAGQRIADLTGEPLADDDVVFELEELPEDVSAGVNRASAGPEEGAAIDAAADAPVGETGGDTAADETTAEHEITGTERAVVAVATNGNADAEDDVAASTAADADDSAVETTVATTTDGVVGGGDAEADDAGNFGGGMPNAEPVSAEGGAVEGSAADDSAAQDDVGEGGEAGCSAAGDRAAGDNAAGVTAGAGAPAEWAVGGGAAGSRAAAGSTPDSTTRENTGGGTTAVKGDVEGADGRMSSVGGPATDAVGGVTPTVASASTGGESAGRPEEGEPAR